MEPKYNSFTTIKKLRSVYFSQCLVTYSTLKINVNSQDGGISKFCARLLL